MVGGGEKYVVYMCRAMKTAAALRGEEVAVSLLAFGDDPGVYPIGHDLTCEVIGGRPWDPYSIDIKEYSARITAAEVIFVHQCLSPFGLFTAAHSRLAKKFVVGIDHGGGEHRLVSHTPELGRVYDLFLAQSRFAANSFRDIEGRVEVIIGPVDTAFYKADSAAHRDHKLVLAVGRILPHKGFERIIRALPEDLRLVIVGSGYDRDYREYLQKLRHRVSVEIREHQTDDEVRRLLQTAGIFVHASTHVDYLGTYYPKPELLGLAPLEALSAGTPALVSSAGALPELSVVNGCVAFSDDTELADLLERHSNSSIEFPTCDEIHRDVERHYGLANFGEKLMSVIYSDMH